MLENRRFELKTDMKPAGDQPTAIADLLKKHERGDRHSTLLGATGTGKTFTIANVIQAVQKPTLVIAHNKTLAAQLAQEFKEFFPGNSVSYFVSYYDFYQPEAYVAASDTYIEKEAMINEEIERLRHAATQALLTRRDTIVVASVSCIYGLGSPEEYEKVNFKIQVGQTMPRGELVRQLIRVHYERTSADLKPGLVRAVGPAVEVMPISERSVVRVTFAGEEIAAIEQIDGVTREKIGALDYFYFFPAKHFITEKDQIEAACRSIESELEERLRELEREGKVLEHERLKRRTRYDLAMIREVGYTNGIENYSRHFSGFLPGQPPDTLLSYFPRKADGSPDFLTVIDESHVTVPQIGGMYAGDRSRKDNLVEYGFRLPSCRDNRPLKFDEFEARVGQTIYVSATPGKFELGKSDGVAEQIIRPTGLVDPEVEIRPVTGNGAYQGQVPDFIATAEAAIAKGGRVLATTLTKKMAEDLAKFLEEKGVRAKYLHSDVKTIERIEILTALRKGEFDILVGVNLLREGLDLPEVTLIGILDADKEGFLRSETSLIQTIGRAARNSEGKVILYADQMTGSLDRAVAETERRRNIQLAYNREHGITPKTIQKAIKSIAESMRSEHDKALAAELAADLGGKKPTASLLQKLIKRKEKEMNAAAKMLDFETAALLRDEIAALEAMAEKGAESDEARAALTSADGAGSLAKKGKTIQRAAAKKARAKEATLEEAVPLAGRLAKGRGWAANKLAAKVRASDPSRVRILPPEPEVELRKKKR